MSVRGCQLVNRFNHLLNSSASYISKQVKTSGKNTHRPQINVLFDLFTLSTPCDGMIYRFSFLLREVNPLEKSELAFDFI